MQRAREAHERYGRSGRAGRHAPLLGGDPPRGGRRRRAHTLCADAGALIAVTGSVYDTDPRAQRHARAAGRARGGRAGRRSRSRPRPASSPESQGSMQLPRATPRAIEAASRASTLGEVHSGVPARAHGARRRSRTAALECGIEVRALACRGAAGRARPARRATRDPVPPRTPGAPSHREGWPGSAPSRDARTSPRAPPASSPTRSTPFAGGTSSPRERRTVVRGVPPSFDPASACGGAGISNRGDIGSTTAPGEQRRRKVAVILSGGGARGAYEVGVLSYVLDAFARLRAGAAAHRHPVRHLGGRHQRVLPGGAPRRSDAGVRRLVDLWTAAEPGHGARLRRRQATWACRSVLLGGGRSAVGLFDVTPMQRLVEREIPWRAIARTLRHGYLSALSVSATEVATGRTVIFMQTGPDGALPTTAPPRTIIRGALDRARARARVGGDPDPVPAGAHRPRSVHGRGRAAEHADRAGAAARRDARPRGRPVARGARASTRATAAKPPGAGAGARQGAERVPARSRPDRLRGPDAGEPHDRGRGAGVYGPDFLRSSEQGPRRCAAALPYRRVETLVVRPSEDIGAPGGASYVRGGQAARRAGR